MPATSFISVDFPPPDGPWNSFTVPFSISNEAWFTTSTERDSKHTSSSVNSIFFSLQIRSSRHHDICNDDEKHGLAHCLYSHNRHFRRSTFHAKPVIG